MLLCVELMLATDESTSLAMAEGIVDVGYKVLMVTLGFSVLIKPCNVGVVGLCSLNFVQDLFSFT